MKKIININTIALLFLFLLKGEFLAIGPASSSSPTVDAYTGLLVDSPDTPPWFAPFHPDVFGFTAYFHSPIAFLVDIYAGPPPQAGRLLDPSFAQSSTSRHLYLVHICQIKSISHKSSETDPAAAFLS